MHIPSSSDNLLYRQRFLGCHEWGDAKSVCATVEVRKFSLTATKRFVYSVVVKKKPPKPTASELEILEVLWRIGPATVRDVHKELTDVGYTTVLKLLQIMTEKRLVERDDRERAHIYRPALKQEDTQRQIVSEVLEKVFGGSASQLVLRALSAKKASKQELTEIREMLDRMEQGGDQ